MSKPVKDMIMAEYGRRLEGVDGAVVLEIRGIDSVQTNKFRLDLHKKKVRVTVMRNDLARKTIAGTKLEPISKVLAGPSAIAYGESVIDVARAIVEWAEKAKEFKLKGAVLDGNYFDGKAGVEALSKYPTREEAQAKVVSVVLAPGSKILGAAKSPGAKVLGIVKQVQEKLEKGEAISKVG